MSGRHTIVLLQTSHHRATRTFMDYDSISQAMDGICALYERKLKELYPSTRNITYDISDLYKRAWRSKCISERPKGKDLYFFLLSGLSHEKIGVVYDHSVQAYLPWDRHWIKHRMMQHLKKMSQ